MTPSHLTHDATTPDAGRPHESPLPSLSVVLPVFNGVGWVEATLQRLFAALEPVPAWHQAEIVVVDDGSDDGTSELLDHLAACDRRLRVVHQPNRGRFLARRIGIETATGRLVLLLDVRLFVEADSLRYLAEQLVAHPERTVWNAHTEIDTSENPFAGFWSSITFMAWRRYLAAPSLISFGEEDFEQYPKGTGGFVAPRQALLDGYAAFTTLYDDLRRVNDDTALLRHVARAHRINLGPRFAFTYHARVTFRQFLHHAHVRGIHFVDGYLRRSSRYAAFIVAFLVATPVGIALLVAEPLWTVGVVGVLTVAAGIVARLLGVPARSARTFALLLPPFAVVYGAGIWRGALLALRSRLRRSRR